MEGIHPACISAVYDAFTAQNVTDSVTKTLPNWDKARKPCHSPADLQQALAHFTRQVEASQGLSDVQDIESDDGVHMDVTEGELASDTPPRWLVCCTHGSR